ncbi:NACHT C-terminal helical domain 2-containing protein [Nostoc sp.]|uniref:NACHT C-terminal helical domain 2-containing protein n=1 Tax=Nostoc sp. TaxID=1180 RepID=UPI002FF47B64
MTEPRWRKVFLLTAGMLDNPTYLLQLIKQHIDGLVAFDKQLQEFLIWLEQKSVSVQTPYKSAAIRAFYLTLVFPDGLSLADDLALCIAIESRLASNLAPDLNIDQALNCALHLSLALYRDPTLDRVLALNFAFPDDRVVYNPELQREANLSPLRESLQQLKEKLPVPVQGTEQLKQWWNANGQAWTETLRSVMLRYRNIGHQWQFSEQQKKVLKQYYTANQLLVNCLNSSCEVTSPVREKILETLFLPVTRASSSMWHHRPKRGKLYAKAEIHIT